MARIPDATGLIQGGAPRSQRGIVSFDSGAGQGLMQAGKALATVGAELNEVDEANNKIAASRAILRIKQEEAALDEEIRQDPTQYEAIRTKWADRFGKLYDESEKTFSSQKYKDLFSIAAQEQFLTIDSRFADVQKKYRGEHIDADFMSNVEAAKSSVRPDMSPAELSALTGATGALVDGYSKEKGVDWAMQKKLAAKQEIDSRYLDLQNPRKAYDITSNQLNRKTPVGTILANELDADGVVRVHEDGNGLAIGGIHYNPKKEGGKAFEKEFFEAKQILETQGQDAAKEYLRNFYDQKIVKANRIDLLPADVQDVVADGITNHGSGFQKKLLEAARNGVSRNELLDMRQAEYDRLAASPNAAENKWDVAKKGWDNRIKKLRSSTPSSYQFDSDAAMASYNQSKAYVIQETKKKADDDFAAAESGVLSAPTLTQEDFLGDENSYASYKNIFDAKAQIGKYSAMPFSEVAKDVQSSAVTDTKSAAENQKLFEMKAAAAKADLEKWAKDPSQMAYMASPSVKALYDSPDFLKDPIKTKAAVDESIKVQQAKGVLSPRILTEAKAEQISAEIGMAESKGGDGAIELLLGYRQLMGEQYYSKLVGEIAPKLSPAARAITPLNMLDPESRAVASDIIQLASKSVDDVGTSILPSDKDRIKATVTENLADLQKTLYLTNPGEAASTYNHIYDGALKAAYAKAGAGSSASDAAQYATSPFTKNYVFRDTYRVPTVILPAEGSKPVEAIPPRDAAVFVQSAIEKYMRGIEDGDLEIPETARANFSSEVYTDAIKARGKWVNMGDESGLRLVDEFNKEVRDKSGAAIFIPFADLVKNGKIDFEKAGNDVAFDVLPPGRF